jgi:hypothetical protein
MTCSGSSEQGCGVVDGELAHGDAGFGGDGLYVKILDMMDGLWVCGA